MLPRGTRWKSGRLRRVRQPVVKAEWILLETETGNEYIKVLYT